MESGDMWVSPSEEVSEICVGYRWTDGHMETPERVHAAWRGVEPLVAAGVWSRVASTEAATDADVGRAHSPAMVAAFRSLERGRVDAAYFPNATGSDAAALAKASRYAVGAVLQLARREVRRGLALARPPGHHATSEQSGGNGCLNSIAIAARDCAARGRRVLVVDLDVHFSGGTSDIVAPGGVVGRDVGGERDDEAARIALVDIYGARGQPVMAHARKEGRRWRVVENMKNTVAINVALLDEAAGDDVYNGVEVRTALRSAVETHQPDIVLVSCGLDAADGDDEGFTMTPAGYGAFFSYLSSLVSSRRAPSSSSSPAGEENNKADTPIILALEGGYKPALIEPCIREIAAALSRAA